MTSVIRRFRLAVAVLGLLGVTSRAEASLITYIETTTASGTLGGTAFTNALVTITAPADTNNVTSIGSSFFSVPVVARVTVANVGSGTFTEIVQVSSGANASPLVGFSAKRLVSDPFYFGLLGTQDAALTNYNLQSSIGPITGGAFSNPGRTFATTVGDFVINSLTTSTFSATGPTVAVPEPSSLSLLGVAGVLGLGYTRARRKRAMIA